MDPDNIMERICLGIKLDCSCLNITVGNMGRLCYPIVMGAGAKAKTVTNNLPLLSVLGVGIV